MSARTGRLFPAFQFPEVVSSSEGDDSDYTDLPIVPPQADFFHFDVETEDVFEKLLPLLVSRKLPDRQSIVNLISLAQEHLASQENVLKINFEAPTVMNIFGDTHGQFFDVARLLELLGRPSENNLYLFNGDYVDRGSFSVELLVTLLSLVIQHKSHFFLLRGNHESVEMTSQFGFQKEVMDKYDNDSDLYLRFVRLFDHIPIAGVLNEKIFIAHGGLFPHDGITIADIDCIDRTSDRPQNTQILFPLLWSDPSETGAGRRPSVRGCREAVEFGHEVTREFLENNKLLMIIRSHQVVDDGYQLLHHNLLVTLFSAPNYCRLQNKGAYMKLNADLSFTFHQFDAAPTPPAKSYFTADFSPLSCVIS